MSKSVNDNTSKFPELVRIRTNYDELFKEELEHFSDEQTVMFINSTFGKNFPLDSKVTFLWTESNLENRRLSDLYIKIADSTFHMEIQSGEDGTMVLRMFEYGFRAAMQTISTDGNARMKLTFPDPVVFYLRGGRNTPTELALDVEFPHLGQTITYTVPTIRMIDYTFKQLADERKIPLMPFYPLKYEEAFSNGNERDLFFAELKEVPAILQGLQQNSVITESQQNDILRTFKSLAEQTIRRTKIESLKGDEEAMGAVQEMETFEIESVWATMDLYKKLGREEGIEQGIEQGKYEALTNAVLGVLKLNLPSLTIGAIVKNMGVSEEQFNEIKASVKQTEKSKVRHRSSDLER
jgi:hypothetical protein